MRYAVRYRRWGLVLHRNRLRFPFGVATLDVDVRQLIRQTLTDAISHRTVGALAIVHAVPDLVFILGLIFRQIEIQMRLTAFLIDDIHAAFETPVIAFDG